MLSEANPCPTIAVKDLANARKFYEDTLGLKVMYEQKEAGVVVYHSGQGAVQIYASDMAGTNKATYCTWEVTGISEVANGLADAGVEFEHYDMPGTTLEGHVHTFADEKAAWFKDPDGNILCLHEKV